MKSAVIDQQRRCMTMGDGRSPPDIQNTSNQREMLDLVYHNYWVHCFTL